MIATSRTSWQSIGRRVSPFKTLIAAIACVPLITTAATSPAQGAEGQLEASSVSASGSQRLQHLGRLEIPGAMSLVFSTKRPRAYVQTRLVENEALVVLDIQDPRTPKRLGHLALPNVSAEDINLAERDDGTTFVILGPADPSGGGPGLTVVDVSDDYDPKVVGVSDHGSHSWTCLSTECKYVYGTAGPEDELDQFTIMDLRKPDRPAVGAVHPSKVDGGLITHDWNYDQAGVMWAAGSNGIAAYGTKSPLEPALLNLSDLHGQHGFPEYNDRLHLHGTLRPNAAQFKPSPDPLGNKESASVHDGNVLLVSEEGTNQDCTDSFQTWYVPRLDGLPDDAAPNSGTITPLDSWNLLNDTTPGETRPSPNGEWCSVHWFDYHQDGFVVVPAYGQGTHVLDVNNPFKIKQVGYHFAPRLNGANQSNWVPERDRSGHTTGRATTLVYTADMGSHNRALAGFTPVTGGIDIFEFEPPVAE